MLEFFYQEIERILTNNLPLNEQLRHMRNLVCEYLIIDNFRLACVESVITSIKHYQSQQKTWNEPELFYHDKLKFSVRLITWPAFYENNPHEHKTWSVTGVIHNQLDINTYTMLNAGKQLKLERALNAAANAAGFLIPGCIHRVSNPSHELSASIHIFNNLDISQPENNAIWYPLPRKFNLSKGLAERALAVCLAIVSGCENSKALLLLEEIYQLAPAALKYLAIQAMYSLDHSLAHDCHEKLKETLLTCTHQHIGV